MREEEEDTEVSVTEPEREVAPHPQKGQERQVRGVNP